MHRLKFDMVGIYQEKKRRGAAESNYRGRVRVSH
jgi:hypothetical protein